MKKITFDNFVRLSRGFDLPERKIVDGEYPVVASTNIKAYHNAYKVKPPVVVTGRSGSLGKVQYIDSKCWPLNTSLYSKDFRGNSPKYIYFFLQTMHLEQYNAGAGVPTLNQNHLQRLKIVVHDIDEQKKVADILSTYDNLIENNKKRIKLIEQIAENLYKEWFVRFRFPGYEDVTFENGIPKEWKNTKLERLANISTGKCNREDAEEDGAYPLFDRSQEIKRSNVWLKDCEAIIVPGEGTSFIPRYYNGKFNLHQRCYCVEPLEKGMGFFLYQTLMMYRIYFLYVATGATVPSLRLNNFNNFKVLLPKKELCFQYNEIAEKMNDEILLLKKKNELLAKQRDLLLPRLMSGKLEV